MRKTTVEHWEGEYLGPVDWSFDFDACGWDKKVPCNPAMIPEWKEFLKQCEAGNCEATTDGGWPRFGWGNVLRVGMYDGWPYWKPVPSVLISGPLGASWHSWNSLTGVRPINPLRRVCASLAHGTEVPVCPHCGQFFVDKPIPDICPRCGEKTQSAPKEEMKYGKHACNPTN